MATVSARNHPGVRSTRAELCWDKSAGILIATRGVESRAYARSVGCPPYVVRSQLKAVGSSLPGQLGPDSCSDVKSLVEGHASVVLTPRQSGAVALRAAEAEAGGEPRVPAPSLINAVKSGRIGSSMTRLISGRSGRPLRERLYIDLYTSQAAVPSTP